MNVREAAQLQAVAKALALLEREVEELRARVAQLEQRRKPGRPRKDETD